MILLFYYLARMLRCMMFTSIAVRLRVSLPSIAVLYPHWSSHSPKERWVHMYDPISSLSFSICCVSLSLFSLSLSLSLSLSFSLSLLSPLPFRKGFGACLLTMWSAFVEDLWTVALPTCSGDFSMKRWSKVTTQPTRRSLGPRWSTSPNCSMISPGQKLKGMDLYCAACMHAHFLHTYYSLISHACQPAGAKRGWTHFAYRY